MVIYKKNYAALFAIFLTTQACGKSAQEVNKDITDADAPSIAASIEQEAEAAKGNPKQLTRLKDNIANNLQVTSKCSATFSVQSAATNQNMTTACSILEIALLRWYTEFRKDLICALKKEENLASVTKNMREKLNAVATLVGLNLKDTTTCPALLNS